MNMLNNIPNQILENVVINMLEWRDIINYLKSNKSVFKEFDRFTWYKLIDNINIENYRYNNYSKTNPLLPEHSYIQLMDQTVLCDDIKDNIYFKLFTTKCLHKHLITKYKNNSLKKCWYSSIRENNVDDYIYFNLFIDTTTIDSYAFQNNQLTEVIIPNSVKTIDSYAFQNNQLKTVNIPDSVKKIGESVFSDNQITKVIISNYFKSMNISTMETYYDNNLTKVIYLKSILLNI